jgi:23S rRNA pseudouridine2605 synthase
LTPEQLQSVRADRWRQNSNPVLTLEDAAAWVGGTGLCLVLPRRNQFLTSAPSFVEACLGAPSDTPALSDIANARGLMIRLVESGAALPLNLFGGLSEQPDFLASREAFPYIFSLRGGRNWKTPPPKASPLVTAIWKVLEEGASLETTEIQTALGHAITESAVVRGLMDLWGGLRVMPVYEQDGPTRWQLTQTRFEDALNAANKTAQTTGLSALVSMYLESVLAATPEEIETFLSSLTARSKVREVVNGLAATRQISIVPVGTQTMFHVAGSLPEFAEPEPVAPSAPVARPTFTRERSFREPRDSERRPAFGRDRGGQRPRTGPSRDRFAAAGSDRPRPRSASGARPGGPGGPGHSSGRPQRAGTDSRGNYPPRRKQFGATAGRPPRPRAEGDRPSYRKPAFGTPGEGEQRPKSYPRKPEGAGGERKTFTKRPFGQRPDSRPARPYGEGRVEGRPDSRSGSGKFPPKKFAGGGKFPPKKFGGDRGKFPPKKFDSGRPRPWKGGEAGARRSASSEGRPFRPRREEPSGRPRSPRPYDAGKPGEGQKRPFFRDKPGRPSGKVDDRSGTSEKSAPPQRGWKPKPSGFSKSAKPGFGKAKFGGAKFGSSRPGGAKFGGSKFGGKKFGGPPARGKSGGARPGFKSGPKPGGSKPPFRKRKDKEDKGNKSSE